MSDDLISAVAFAPDGKTAASAGGEFEGAGDVSLWNPQTGRRLRTLENEDWTTSVAFSPDSQTLATGVSDFNYDNGLTIGKVKLWNVRTGKLKQSINFHTEGVNAISFSSDGRLLAAGSDNGLIRLWRVH